MLAADTNLLFKIFSLKFSLESAFRTSSMTHAGIKPQQTLPSHTQFLTQSNPARLADPGSHSQPRRPARALSFGCCLRRSHRFRNQLNFLFETFLSNGDVRIGPPISSSGDGAAFWRTCLIRSEESVRSPTAGGFLLEDTSHYVGFLDPRPSHSPVLSGQLGFSP